MIIYRYSASCRVFTKNHAPFKVADFQRFLGEKGLVFAQAQTVYDSRDHYYCFFDFEILLPKPFHQPERYVTERLIRLHQNFLARLARKKRASKLLSSPKAKLRISRIAGVRADNQTPTSPCDACSNVYPMETLQWHTQTMLCLCETCYTRKETNQ